MRGHKEMLCTICRKKLGGDYIHVWRTLDTMKSGKPVQWAKIPVHKDCKEQTEHEIMKSKIGNAAGLDCFMYSMDEPRNVDERPIDEYSKLRRGY
jgi:hypothetical protein